MAGHIFINLNRITIVMCLYLVKSCNSAYELYEGAACSVEGSVGVCTDVTKCKPALEAILLDKRPKICSFAGVVPIVCCLDKVATNEIEATTKVQWVSIPSPVVTEPAASTPAIVIGLGLEGSDTTITRREDPLDTFSHDKEGCPPIPPTKTALKTGQKAWDKCIEYQEQLVFPCDRSQRKRFNDCRNDQSTWILGGQDAFHGEFPHMALVGYRAEEESLKFPCGGSLVSDRFVLTAGHCTMFNLGPVTHVLLGVFNRSIYDQSNLHKVQRIHRHPKYLAPKKYHDIALLQLELPVQLTAFTVPACLDVGDVTQHEKAVATGWGTTQYMGALGEVLQKVDLTQFTDAECAARYPLSRLLIKGYDNTTQLCYGDRTLVKDTCQGDSGGPLQVRHKKIYCMYTVIGVTSLGRACGVPGEPALYTRVSHYLPWIEAIVWPDNE